jgi:hypothetical protein
VYTWFEQSLTDEQQLGRRQSVPDMMLQPLFSWLLCAALHMCNLQLRALML